MVEVLELLRLELSKKGIHVFKDIVPPNNSGNNIMVTCPFHGGGQERNPSFGVVAEDSSKVDAGVSHCFTCGKTMNLPKLVSTLFKIEDRGEFGKAWLEEYFEMDFESMKLEGTSLYVEEGTTINHKKYINPSLPYITQRGLSESTAVEFELGYNSYRDSLVIPVLDRFGKTRMMIERGINQRTFHNTSGATKEGYMFGIYQTYKYLDYVQQQDEIWITEGSIDAMLLWQYGKPALATLQAVPSEDNFRIINRLPVSRVIIATDNDAPGHDGATHYISGIKYPKEVRRVIFPNNVKDIGDMTPDQIKSLQSYVTKRGEEIGKNPWEITVEP